MRVHTIASRAVAGAALLLLGMACAGTEADLRTEDLRHALLGQPGGRSVAGHVLAIDRSIVPGSKGQPYGYRGKIQVAHHRVLRSVRGLGAARISTHTELTNAVDALIFVAAHDPTALIRATACGELGRVAARLPPVEQEDAAHDPRVAPASNLIAGSLQRFQRRMEAGESVPAATVTARLRALAKLRPADNLSARRMLRAVASRPVAGSTGEIAEEARRLVPGIVRRCVLVFLGTVAAGDPVQPGIAPDPSPDVRADAFAALWRLASPVARRGALRRLGDPIDPPERDPDVRRAILRYLSRFRDPEVFDACLTCLDDLDLSVRYAAQEALCRISGVYRARSAADWRAWRKKHREWQVDPGTESAGGPEVAVLSALGTP